MNEHQCLITKDGIEITLVKEVDSFSEREVRLTLEGGGRMAVLGEGLKINGFSKQNGNCSLKGRILSVRYLGASEKLLKKIFK